MSQKLNGFYDRFPATFNVRYFAHNGNSKIKIKSHIASNSGYNRQAFFLFSVAGANPWATVFRCSTENYVASVTYSNIIGNVITSGTASTEGGYVVGTFALNGGKYDGSTVFSHDTFTVAAV